MTKFICGMLLFFVFSVSAHPLDKGIEYFKQGDFENALVVFEQLIDENDENADAFYWLGRTCFMLRNFEQASEYLEEAIELNDKNADYYFWYGNALGNEIQTANVLKQAMMAGDILEAYENAIEVNPDHVGAHIGAAQYYLQAPGIMGGDIDKAKEQAGILKSLGSKDGDLILIGILVKEEKYDEAEKAYDKFHQSFVDTTDNPFFYNSYGYFLLSQKKYDKAILMLKRQVELLPESANPYDSLGDGYRANGQLKEALACYEKALELDSTFAAPQKKVEELKKELAK
jgi:tetratricopeptide (TPR) repeat protein